MNLDQIDVHDMLNLVSRPMDEPTEFTFHILHIQLAKFMGRQWDLCFGITLPTYQNVLELEQTLRKFELEIPSSLRYQTAQSALARPYLTFQNHMLTFEVAGLRVLLLSPFMFVHPTKESELEELSEAERKQALFHKHAKSVCIAYAKRQLAHLQMYETQAGPAHLAWSGLAMVAFGSAMILVISMIIDPRNSENEQLAEWIVIAEDLLKNLLPINRLAVTALQHLEIIRRRSDLVLCMMGRGRPCSGSEVLPPQTLELSQRLQRATGILSQPVPCMTDLLGHVSASDPFWSTWRTGLYSGHFPGIESLSGGVDPQGLENFLDNCVSMQSRMPPTIAV
ncbi:hypothetical protein OF83DRAFT_1103821 [Amylostereum chailletii]|nr:hypothetical protein OF83DRAFT_1103821 [Amylostereum chailletii]